LRQWLDKAIKPPRCTLNTYRSYSDIITNHIEPALGHISLQQLTHLHIERYYSERKLKPSTVKIHHAILTTALRSAVKSQLIRRSVVSLVANKPRVVTHEDVLTNVWTPDEARAFLDYVKQHESAQYVALFALMLDSGCRRGEVLGLKWSDLSGTKLKVERQLDVLNDKDASVLGLEPDASRLQFTLPKGKRARTIELSEETVRLLLEHKRVQSETKMKNRLHYNDHGLMVAQNWEQRFGWKRLGMPLSNQTLGAQLDKLCADAGVKRITVHGLRHTCATLLLLAGTPPNVVQRRMGHKKVEMTLNVYSHALPSMQEDAAKRLALLLHG
jgi:integrase